LKGLALNKLTKNVLGFLGGAGLTTLALIPVYNRAIENAKPKPPEISAIFQKLETMTPRPAVMRCDHSPEARFTVVVSRPSPERDTITFFSGQPPQQSTRNGSPDLLPLAVLEGDLTPQKIQEKIVDFCSGKGEPRGPAKSAKPVTSEAHLEM
jgi:hypothetical protein